MKSLIILAVLTVSLLALQPHAHAFFIDFEDGVDGELVNDIPGVAFEDFNGLPSIYADCRTDKYNCTSDDLGYSRGTGNFHHNGNFSIWAGLFADARGVIVDFTVNDGTWFTTGYSSAYEFYIEGHMTDGSVITNIGAGNTGGPMGYLSVYAPAGLYLDYVVLHDHVNFWILDDMSGDASGVGITTEQVPEPATLMLLGTGLVAMGFAGAKRRRAVAKKA